jgi:hypothetical protein
MRIENFEFRKLENRDAEIVAWNKQESGKEYCYTIAFFNKDKEGYDMRTVGDRILVDDYDTLHKLIKYAFTVLHAEFELMADYV